MTETITSPKRSFLGWSIGVWAVKNKDLLKLSISTIGTLIGGGIGNVATWPVVLIGIGGVLVTVGFKLAADAIDYYFTDVTVTV